MSIRIETTYSPEAVPWLKGNLHTHTTNSDGSLPPQETVDAYAALGHDFLMLSDHDRFTDPDELDGRGMTLVPGVEVTRDGPHVVHVGTRTCIEPTPDRQQVLDAIAADQGFGIMAHPNWEAHFNHCPQEKLEEWQGYAGIEICNGVCFIAPGSGYALDRWDQLLGKGRRVWGYGNDDTHSPDQMGAAWNVVQSPSRDANAIVDALRTGRFYVSTGVEIDCVRVSGRTIGIRTKNAQSIAAYGDFYARVAVVDGAEIQFTLAEDSELSYVRFECHGPGMTGAWTQPFFIERD